MRIAAVVALVLAGVLTSAEAPRAQSAPDGAGLEVGGLVFPDLAAFTAPGAVLTRDETLRFNVPVQNPDNILVRVWILPFFEDRDPACEISYQGADAIRLSGMYPREIYLTGGCDEIVMDGLDIVVLHEQTGQEWQQRIMLT